MRQFIYTKKSLFWKEILGWVQERAPHLGGLDGDAALEEDRGDVGEDSTESAQRRHPKTFQVREPAPRASLCRQEPRNVSSTGF